jgi:hypothetical protein
MQFFLEVTILSSSRLWRYVTKISPQLHKGLVDDSNLKTKVSYLQTRELFVFLQAFLMEYNGKIIRKGKHLQAYYLVFNSEKDLNSFLITYASIFIEIPVIVIEKIGIKNSLYRFDDYYKLISLTPNNQKITNFLEMHLTIRGNQIVNPSLFFHQFMFLLRLK